MTLGRDGKAAFETKKPPRSLPGGVYRKEICEAHMQCLAVSTGDLIMSKENITKL